MVTGVAQGIRLLLCLGEYRGVNSGHQACVAGMFTR